jgi:hypothetical protein
MNRNDIPTANLKSQRLKINAELDHSTPTIIAWPEVIPLPPLEVPSPLLPVVVSHSLVLSFRFQLFSSPIYLPVLSAI